MRSLQCLQREYDAIVANLHCSVTAEDYERIACEIARIKEIGQLEMRAFSLYDIAKRSFLLQSKEHLRLLGYGEIDILQKADEERTYHSMIHPEDLPYLYDAELKMFQFLHTLKGPEKKHYKLVYDYRVKNKEGSYLRFLHQLSILELDQWGNSWIMSIISDVLSLYPDGCRPHRFLVNTTDNTIWNLENGCSGQGKTLLTNRERQIFMLTAQGFDSKSIADHLCISLHTVNNHRQHILAKTGTVNMVQAVYFLTCIGGL